MAISPILLRDQALSLRHGPSLTAAQARADALVSSFVDHATDGYSLAAMVGGGLVYRLGRLGTLAIGSRLVGATHASPLQALVRLGSIGIGFTGEVFAFEAGQRALRVGIGGADPNLLNWSGENGLGRGLVGAAITLGPLKGAGVFAQGQNPVIQHLFQDSAMVLAHNVSDRIFTCRGDACVAPTIAEQFVNAEATLWQMNAGMALVHGAFPTLGQLDRSLDLSIRGRDLSPALSFVRRGSPLSSPSLRRRGVGGGLLEPLLQGVSVGGSRSSNLLMMSSHGNEGESGSNSQPTEIPSSLASLLLKVSLISEPSKAVEAFRVLYTGISHPHLREAIYRSLKEVEGGVSPEQAVLRLLEEIPNRLKNPPQNPEALFLSPRVENRIAERIAEIQEETPINQKEDYPWIGIQLLILKEPAPSTHPLFARVEAVIDPDVSVATFQRLDPQVRGWVLRSWRAYYQRLREYRIEALGIPREYQSDHLGYYRSDAHDFLSNNRVDNRLARIVVLEGQRYFPIRARILYEVKIQRLREFYRLPISPKLQAVLFNGLQRLASRDWEQPIHFDHNQAPLHAVTQIFPTGPRWFHELLIHFYTHLEKPVNDFGFVLRTARLVRALSQEKAREEGFAHQDIFRLEEGEGLRRNKFRSVAIFYGIPYPSLAFAYRMTRYPFLRLEKLALFREEIFFERREVEKLRRYLKRTPTLGERFFLARAGRDLTWEEMRSLVLARGIDPTTYDQVEDNKAYPALETLRVFGEILNLPLDEMLTLLQATYYPRLKHPRLKTEPVYINVEGESTDDKKIAAYQEQPGSFGEEIFFRRKRRFLSIAQLGAMCGISKWRVIDFENNRAKPTEAEIDRLVEILRLDPLALRSKVAATPYPRFVKPMARKIVTRTGTIDWNRIQERPRLRVFKRMALDLDMAPGELALVLNQRFSPSIDLNAFPSYGGDPIYISNAADEAKLLQYRQLGYQSFGELIFFARKSLNRNWDPREAAEKLKINRQTLESMERNEKEPSEKDLQKLSEVYRLDLDLLRSVVQKTYLPRP